MCAWFLKIVSVQTSVLCVCVFVCLPVRLLITSGVIWTPYDWLNKGYSFYMAAVVIIGGRCGLRIEACIEAWPKSKLLLYSHYFHFNIHSCTQAARWSALVIKVGVVFVCVCILRCLKEELA